MNKKIWLLFLFASVLLTLAWFPNPATPLLFIAFIPMLKAMDECKQNGVKNILVWFGIYFSLLIWNVATTWWVWNASAGGAAAAFILNALLQSFPLMAFYVLQNKFSSKIKWIALPIFWIAFEKTHLTWEFTWPWLTLGNGFAPVPQWVQWYNITGHLGGSAWIWLCNISFYLAIFENEKTHFFKRWWKPIATVFVPLIFSFVIYFLKKEANTSCKREYQNFILIQPNVDPYNEKFVIGNEVNQAKKLVELAEKNYDSISPFIFVAPETALPSGIWWDEINNNSQIAPLKQFLLKHKNATFITGATILESYNFQKTESASQVGTTNKFVDMFNAALLLNSSDTIQKYYKSKLVPGVERMPYPGFFKFLKPLLIDMGGVSDNTGTQPDRTVFKTNNFCLAPLICYESVYGSFVSEFVKNGANVLLIITNDGWWGNTPGYRQHFEYARLRAIETHRYVLQCANTGSSGVIDEFGNVLQKTDYWKEAIVKSAVPLYDDKTFFVQYGNAMEWSVVVLSVLIILVYLVTVFIKIKK